MFDVGFSELCLIGIVALLVLGPERLPRAARVAGLWIGRAKRAVAGVQSDVKRELYLEDLKRATDLGKLRQVSQEEAARLTALFNETSSNLSQAASAIAEQEHLAVALEDAPATEPPERDAAAPDFASKLPQAAASAEPEQPVVALEPPPPATEPLEHDVDPHSAAR
jgi:sec-independent protein translocase protein TatB